MYKLQCFCDNKNSDSLAKCGQKNSRLKKDFETTYFLKTLGYCEPFLGQRKHRIGHFMSRLCKFGCCWVVCFRRIKGGDRLHALVTKQSEEKLDGTFGRLLLKSFHIKVTVASPRLSQCGSFYLGFMIYFLLK